MHHTVATWRNVAGRFGSGLIDASRLERDGGERGHHHRLIIDLTVRLDVRRHLAPLVEPIDAAFHDIEMRVDSPLRVRYGLAR